MHVQEETFSYIYDYINKINYYALKFKTGTIGIDTQHLPVLAIMHPMASGRMRLHHQFNNIGQRQGRKNILTSIFSSVFRLY